MTFKLNHCMILETRDTFSLMNAFSAFILLNRTKQIVSCFFIPHEKGENTTKLEASIPYLPWKVLIILESNSIHRIAQSLRFTVLFFTLFFSRKLPSANILKKQKKAFSLVLSCKILVTICDRRHCCV